VSDDCAKVGAGGIRFYDLYLPAIEVGDYSLGVTQEVTPPGGSTPETYAASQQFSIAGPRWSLPAEDVFSSVPPAGAVGAFAQFLPHVVLTKPDLPWERDVFRGVEASGRLPWLALLVFADGEPAEPATIPVSELFAAADGSVIWPKLTEEWYETDVVADPATVCTVIDVAPGAFAAQIPSRDRLSYLAHARQVDATAKDSDALRVAGDGWYSVVAAARLPLADPERPVRSTAHLVSLEGLTDVVGTTPAKPVRMVALWSWSFTCVPEAGETFAHLVDGLTAESSTAFALPVRAPAQADAATTYAAKALSRGYVPLRYLTRPGERTFGWYRGPASPVRVPRFSDPSKSFGSASAAMVYDKAHGVFDLSYGVAWETGRTLALSDSVFSRAVLDWRRQGHRLTDLIAERSAQLGVAPGEVVDALQPLALTDGFMRTLIGELGGQLADAGGAAAAPVRARLTDTPPAIAKLLDDPEMRAAVRAVGGQGLDEIADWLAERYMLMGVPFDTIVANADLLPPESIRFFHLDANWQDALLEGALSIGIETSRDVLYQSLMRDLVWGATMRALNGVRTRLTGESPPDPSSDPPEMAGMLMRSALVAGWPGLEVRAYADVLDGEQIPLLRMERLAGGVMICLWPEVPAVVAVDEPSEGVAFGFEDPPDPAPAGASADWLYLRHADEAAYGQPYAQDDEAHRLDAGSLIGADREVDVAALASRLGGVLGTGGPLTTRDLAVQLIKVPERGVFKTREGGLR
jgi:hypothetical protein